MLNCCHVLSVLSAAAAPLALRSFPLPYPWRSKNDLQSLMAVHRKLLWVQTEAFYLSHSDGPRAKRFASLFAWHRWF